MDNYFQNKTASELKGNNFNQNQNFSQMDYNLPTRHTSFDCYQNSMYNQSKLTSSLNSSGIFSNGSNSDENNSNNYDNNYINNKKCDYRENQKTSFKKASSTLFMSEQEPKGEEFADLQELKNSTNMELWDYAKTQKGSRYILYFIFFRNLQKLLNKLQPENIDILLENLKNNFAEMMKDTYGNYFCQKLIQTCSADQRIFILKNVIINVTI